MRAFHRQFVAEYLADPKLNATAAYLRVYPKSSADNARRSASALLRQPDVAAAVAAEMDARRDRVRASADNVVRELARVAFADPRAFFHPDGRPKAPHELDSDTAAALASVETDTSADGGRVRRFKLWPQVEAKVDMRHSAPDLSKLSDDQLRYLRSLVEITRPATPAPEAAR